MLSFWLELCTNKTCKSRLNFLFRFSLITLTIVSGPCWWSYCNIPQRELYCRHRSNGCNRAWRQSRHCAVKTDQHGAAQNQTEVPSLWVQRRHCKLEANMNLFSFYFIICIMCSSLKKIHNLLLFNNVVLWLVFMKTLLIVSHSMSSTGKSII